MFTLLNPLALLGLTLLGIPIVLHLFKPRKVRQMPFSSLRWLRASQHRLSRRIQWHQILLFMMRFAFLFLLVFALARPLFSTGAAQQPAERFVILDVSRSMSYEPEAGSGERTTPLERGRQIAREAIMRGPPGDRTTVVLSGPSPRALGPLLEDPEEYLAQVQSARASLGQTDLADALRLVGPMMAEGRPETEVELIYITDNQQAKWSQAEIASFLNRIERPVRTRVIDVGPENARNAWIANAGLMGSSMDDDPDAPQIIRAVIRGSYRGTDADAEPMVRTVHVTGLPDLPGLSEEIEVHPGRPTEVWFRLPVGYDLTGKIALISLEPSDGLPDDDVYWLNLDPHVAARVLVIEQETTDPPALQPGHHLRVALHALADVGEGAIQITRRAPDDLARSDFLNADAIFMVDVPRLSDTAVQALLERVEAGAGLAMFLGPSIERDFYNTTLHQPAHPEGSLLPTRLGELLEAGRTRGGQVRLTDLQADHPLLRGLLDASHGDLATAGFNTWFDLELPDEADVTVSATLDGGAPAIVDHKLGEGRVLLFNTTVRDQWSDLSRRNSFVTLINRSLIQLSGGIGRDGFDVGQPVLLPLPDAATDGGLSVSAPDGSAVSGRLRAIAGRPVLQVDDPRQHGVYRVDYTTDSGNERSAPFIVRVPRADSRLITADADALQTWWRPAEFHLDSGQLQATGFTGDGARVPLTPWLVLLACAMLLAEMFFVHRWCPAVNPATARSFVAERGMVAGSVTGGAKQETEN